MHMIRKVTKKIIFAVGLLTIASSVYVASFYFFKDIIIQPYEREHDFETHTIRPIYNVLYYPMRTFVANGASFNKEYPDIYYGTLEKDLDSEEPKHRSASIDELEGGLVMIGFTGKPSILKAYDNIEDGSYVKLSFGNGLTNKHDRFINKLINIEVIDLMDDPRIENKEYSDDVRKRIQSEYSDKSAEKRTCRIEFVTTYKERTLEHCLQAGYARNIGGGCYHLLPYFANTAVLEQAINYCAKS